MIQKISEGTVKKKAILVVSFGTSYEDTRKKTINAIEQHIKAEFKEYIVYRAFTSKIILKKLKAASLNVYSVKEALEHIIEDGVTEELVVQPTHIINGTENDAMIQDVSQYEEYFKKVRFGKPLLTLADDYKELAEIIKKTYQVTDKEALVLMGHGSEHYSNSAYPAFEYVLKMSGYENIFVGTVEGYPSLGEVKEELEKAKIRKVLLVPMMIVAGDHANNDMAGDEDSWKAELEGEGYEVSYQLKGLGELTAVQEMFAQHVRKAMKEG